MAGRGVLITGGASGIGRAAARLLAGDGARVLITDVDVQSGQAAADEIGAAFHRLDVADAAQWDDCVQVAAAELGRIDVALLNAGIALGEPDPTKVARAEYRRIMGINVDGVVLGVRAVVPTMESSGGGAIVVTASPGGLTPMPSDPVYSLTKHAVVAFVRSAAATLAQRGIRLNAVCPGFTDTAILNQEFHRQIGTMGLPLLTPEQVADAIARIVSSEDTGQAWYIQPGREPAPYQFRGVPGAVAQ